MFQGRGHTFLLFVLTGILPSLSATAAGDAPLDLSKAVVLVAPDASKHEQKCVEMLLDEVLKRTNVRWQQATDWPAAGVPVIVVGRFEQVEQLGQRFAKSFTKAPPDKAEAFLLACRQDENGPALFVLGHDERGELFGVGRLLRLLRMSPGKVTINRLSEDLATAPTYSLRGHQLGYRPKTNSYDAWDLKQWEQYYRDLIVFGTNAIEILPPRTDDAATSPHFPLPQLEMMAGMSQLAEDYGIDVWIWYPAMDRDYSKPETVEFALKEWGQVFEKLPRIDAVFVPGGDPGHTQPRHLMALLKQETEVLHRTHPKAQMWVSPQSFSQVWLDEFLTILRDEKPAWLSGIVFGPQVRVSLPKLRELVPEQYPIRHYPDITHSRQCQYPVPDWDVAFAVTSGRECINPRPTGQATIFRLLQPQTIGFLTYSEGCNDDVNKIIWSGLGWDPATEVIDILRDYAGYFVGDKYRDQLAQGLMALERNWQGSVISNGGIDVTLEQFQSMERDASPAELGNWRLQMALYRAYYDAYVRRRLQCETEIEERALDRLRAIQDGQELAALDEAEAILDSVATANPAPDLRKRIYELADMLFDSIRLQTSVKRYQAIAADRGATLDTMDYPLNNRRWYKERFAAIRQLTDPAAKHQEIAELVDWTNPGPGGFYDDLGNLAWQPHLVVGPGFEKDPAFLESAHAGFAGPDMVRETPETPKRAWRVSWLDHQQSLREFPLTLEYSELDPDAAYAVKLVYAGDGLEKRIRLEANDSIEIHSFIKKPIPIAPIEFELPREATKTGRLTLRWYREPGLGDNGRGCQVSEIWLIRRSASR